MKKQLNQEITNVTKEKRKKGLIIVNAYCVYASIEQQTVELKDEFAKLDVDIDIKGNNFGPCFIDDGKIVSTIKDIYDFVIYLDKDSYQAAMIEKTGTRVFNNSQAIFDCDDKMHNSIRLANFGIKTPKTISAPFCSRNINDFNFSEVVKNVLGFPVICKESYVTLGAQSTIINNIKELRSHEEKMVLKKHFYQEYIISSRNHDFRAYLINHKVVACIDRRNKDDQRYKLDSLQSDCFAYELNDEYRDIAEKVATEFNLDYCSIDILAGNKGEPIVVDVDSNPFFKGVTNVTGVNVAELYAQYIYNEIYKTSNE
ncbi:MAG: hypothetical protein HUJ61_08455 [Bacilli bacterium]|nr:hypothetical protein [Bacilli bacterium]